MTWETNKTHPMRNDLPIIGLINAWFLVEHDVIDSLQLLNAIFILEAACSPAADVAVQKIPSLNQQLVDSYTWINNICILILCVYFPHLSDAHRGAGVPQLICKFPLALLPADHVAACADALTPPVTTEAHFHLECWRRNVPCASGPGSRPRWRSSCSRQSSYPSSHPFGGCGAVIIIDRDPHSDLCDGSYVHWEFSIICWQILILYWTKEIRNQTDIW